MGLLSKLFGLEKRKEAILEALESGGRIVDVRTASEFRGGHVAGSVNIPLDKLNSKLGKLKKLNKPLVFCCASGMRSGQAVSILRSKGFDNVHNGGSWYKVGRLVG